MMTSLRSKWAAGKARGGRISKLIRNRRATQPPTYFHRNPLGRRQLAGFPSRGCGTRSSRIDLDMLVATASPARTALKNSQLTCGERHAYFGDRTLEGAAFCRWQQGSYNVVRNTIAVPFLDSTKLRWQSAGAINKSPKRNS